MIQKRGELLTSRLARIMFVCIVIVCIAVSVSAILITNVQRPTLTVYFDRPTTVQNASIYAAAWMNVTVVSAPVLSSNYTVWTFAIQQPLAQGEYSLRFLAIDRVFETNEYKNISFTIDLTPPSITSLRLQPGGSGMLSQPNQTIIVSITDNYPGTYVRSATLQSTTGTSLDITSLFVEVSPGNYQASTTIPDGNFTLTLAASDFAGNTVLRTLQFIMNAQPFNLTLIRPPYGASNITPFTVELMSTKQATCRQTRNPVYGWSDMLPFDSTGGVQHIINNFTAGSPLFVICTDYLGVQSPKYTYQFTYDTTPPEISIDVLPNTGAMPRVINEGLDTAVLRVTANEDVQCNYTHTPMTTFAPFESGFGTVVDHTFANETTPLQDGHAYAYYVQCQNRAMLTASANISFSVNLSAAASITVHAPAALLNTQIFKFNVSTTASTLCRHGNTSEWDRGQAFALSGGRQHLSSDITLPDGAHTAYVICMFAEGPVFRQVSFSIDTLPPSATNISTPAAVCSLDEARANFHATDGNATVSRFNYTLVGPNGTVKNWTVSGTSVTLSGLDLAENATYKWQVTALDVVGHPGQLSEATFIARSPTHVSCDDNAPTADVDVFTHNGTTYVNLTCDDDGSGCTASFQYSFVGKTATCTYLRTTTYTPLAANATSKFCYRVSDVAGNNRTGSYVITLSSNLSLCSNDVRDTGESDVDCGGSCPACSLNSTCTRNDDCSSNYCLNSTCTSSNCSDEVKNGMETDVDCGGTCTACALNKTCQVSEDCTSRYCDGTCKEASCTDGVKNGQESDIDCGGTCGLCAIDQACGSNADCASQNCYLGYCISPVTDQPPPPDEQRSILPLILLIIGIVLVLGGTGYIVYPLFMPQPPAPQRAAHQQQARQRPVVRQQPLPVQRQMLAQRTLRKSKERANIFAKFSGEHAEKAPPAKSEEYVDVQDIQLKDEPKEDVFSKLDSISGTNAEQAACKLAAADDLFTELKSMLDKKELNRKTASDALFELMEQQKVTSDQAQDMMRKLDLLK